MEPLQELSIQLADGTTFSIENLNKNDNIFNKTRNEFINISASLKGYESIKPKLTNDNFKTFKVIGDNEIIKTYENYSEIIGISEIINKQQQSLTIQLKKQ